MYLSAETKRFIREHSSDDVRQLALKAGKYPQVDIPAAVTQIAGRQSIAHKVPSWYETEELLYPPHLSIEQCSSEITAGYKASLLHGETFTDLTGGFGIDCAFLSRRFTHADYVERNEQLCNIASHNFPFLGLNQITVHHQDSVEYLKEMERVDAIFIDPARRSSQGKKIVAVSDCEPDVSELHDLLLKKAKRVLIKLSPMLDLSLALESLPQAREVHIVSVSNECKELLIILSEEDKKEIPVHCINFSGNNRQVFTFSRENEQQALCGYADLPRTYLYEPNASILKAGAFKEIASRYNLQKLHANSHLYTSDALIEGFPGRSFRITAFSSPKDKSLLAGIKKANLTVRNFPTSADNLRKQLKLADGGDTYLFATTLANNQKVLIRCEKL